MNWSSGNTEDKQVQTSILDTAAHGQLNTFAPPPPPLLVAKSQWTGNTLYWYNTK